MNAPIVQSQQQATEHTKPAWYTRLRGRFPFRPHTATLMSSMAVLMTVMLVYQEYVSFPNNPFFSTNPDLKWWIATIVGLLLLDRVDEWFYRPAPRHWLAVALLAVHVLLTGANDWLVVGFWYELGTYLALPFIAASYFGQKVGYIMILLIVVKSVVAQDYDPANSFNDITFELVNIALMAVAAAAGNFTRERDRHRAEGERVLANLEGVHARLATSAERTRQTTDERNRLVQEIHEAVGHGLAALDAQIKRARATEADDTVRMAKQVAGEALQNVRRSVSALRSTGEMTGLQAMLDEPAPSRAPVQARPRWRMWLLGNPVDLLQSAGYLLLLSAYVILPNQEYVYWTWQRLLLVGVLLSLLAIDRFEYTWFGDIPLASVTFGFTLARIGLFVTFVMLAHGHWPIWLLVLLPHIAMRYAALHRGWLLPSLVWVGIAVIVGLILRLATPFDYHFWTSATAMFFFVMLFGWATSRAVLHDRSAQRQRDQLLTSLQESHATLTLSVEQELAAVEDRNRVARDIHDGLGHYLTVVNIQLEKALAYWELDPQVADQALLDARELAGEALLEVKASSDELEPTQTQVSLEASVRSPVKHVDGSPPVDLQIVGSEAGFTPPALLALYRATQEGLTNIQKHARASAASVRLAFGDQSAELDLCDDGQGFDLSTLSSPQEHEPNHYGLQGLRERVEMVGGSLTIASALGAGTQLRIIVPRHYHLASL